MATTRAETIPVSSRSSRAAAASGFSRWSMPPYVVVVVLSLVLSIFN